MNNKIKDTEKIETKNLESIPGENDLPDVKSKEYYENLVTERRMNSYEMRKKAQEAASDESIQEVNAEDLDGVAGGYGPETPHKYGGPDMYIIKKPSLKEKIMSRIAFPFMLLKDKINDRKRKKEWERCRKDMEEWEKYRRK